MISSTLGQILHFFYGIISDYALSIIALTLFIKLLLFPLSISQIRATKKMAAVNPQLKELQAKYKDNKEELNRRQIELYQVNKINPLSGCLPLLIQLPILFALFNVLREPLRYVFSGDTSLTDAALAGGFLWISNLSQPDVISNIWANAPTFLGAMPGVLPIISAITTYFQMTSTSAGPQNQTTKTMAYMMPIMILYSGSTFSAGLMLYWTVSNLFQMAQQLIVPKLTKEA
jgi:YidC/Oxa1 family membrane protein insertase